MLISGLVISFSYLCYSMIQGHAAAISAHSSTTSDLITLHRLMGRDIEKATKITAREFGFSCDDEDAWCELLKQT